MNPNNLSPCPFCGREMVQKRQMFHHPFGTDCVIGGQAYPNEDAARWNTRLSTSPDRRDADVERVARVIELAIVRHGVPESDLEGTLDDAQAAIAALSVESPSMRGEGIDNAQ